MVSVKRSEYELKKLADWWLDLLKLAFGSTEDDVILITGSLYMLGKAREYWFPKQGILAEAEYG